MRLITVASLLLVASPLPAADLLPPGHRPAPPGIQALMGAKVVVSPTQTLDHATILIRDGLIEAVGTNLVTPPDAHRSDLTGLTVYAGFIDPCLTLSSDAKPASTSRVEPIRDSNRSGRAPFFGVPGQESDPGNPGPGHDSGRVTPQARVVDNFSPKTKLLEQMRREGFTAANITAEQGIFRGTSTFALLSDANPNEAILKADVFQHVSFSPDADKDNAYPKSLMGVIAVTRQSFLDATHYSKDHDHYREHPQGRQRPSFNPALAALAPAAQGAAPVLLEPGSVLMVDRAAIIARELNLDYLLLSSGQEWRRPDLARTTQARFIVPLAFPEVPKFPAEDDWEQVSLDQLRAWDWAPGNPVILRQQGLEIALTTFGLSDRKKFRPNLALAIKRGLSEADALAALTTLPAQWCGLASQLGTIEPGKLANLTVVDGPTYFDPDNKVREVWIEGRLYRIRENLPPLSTGNAEEKPDDGKEEEKKADELRHTLSAASPATNRGPLAQPSAVLIRGATIWTSAKAGRLSQSDLLAVGAKIVAIGTNLSLPEEHRDTGLTVDGTGRHVTAGLIDAHSHSMILGGVNEGTLPSTAMVRISDVVNSETANLHKQLAGGLTVANLLH